MYASTKVTILFFRKAELSMYSSIKLNQGKQPDSRGWLTIQRERTYLLRKGCSSGEDGGVYSDAEF